MSDKSTMSIREMSGDDVLDAVERGDITLVDAIEEAKARRPPMPAKAKRLAEETSVGVLDSSGNFQSPRPQAQLDMEGERVAITSRVYKALAEIDSLSHPPAEVYAMVPDYRRHELDKLPAVIAWLKKLQGIVDAKHVEECPAQDATVVS